MSSKSLFLRLRKMMRLFLFVFFFLQGGLSALALSPSDSLDVDFYQYTTLMNFYRFSSVADGLGTLNPDNRVAGINKFDIGFYIRPDIEFSLKKERKFLQLFLKPRLNIARDEGFFFQEGRLKWQISDNWSFQGGRYLKELGTSILINPSNPFIFNSTFLNPKIEQKPLGFAEVNYGKGDWNFSFFSNYSGANNPNYEDPYFDFTPNYGIIIERYKRAENSGVIINFAKDQRLHIGSYNIKTLTTSLLFWADASLSYNINRFYPVKGHLENPDLIDYDMINGIKNKNLFFSGIMGLSYATNFGPTLKLEYYYSERGFNDEEFDLFTDMIASSSLYNFDVTVDLANANLARGINPGMPFLRKNYLFFQAGALALFDVLDYNFRVLYSVDDSSTQFSSLLECNAGDLQFFSLLIFNAGSRQSDLKRLINNQIWLGITYRL